MNQNGRKTTIEMTEGQTFAVAGLLDSSVTASKDVTPLLGDVPVLGALFRSVRYQRRETELVVLVTPHIVAPMNPGAKTPPVCFVMTQVKDGVFRRLDPAKGFDCNSRNLRP